MPEENNKKKKNSKDENSITARCKVPTTEGQNLVSLIYVRIIGLKSPF